MNWDLTYTPAGVEVRDLANRLAPAANLILQARLVEDLRVGIFIEDTPWKLCHGRPGYYLKGRAPNAQTYGPTIEASPGASYLMSAEGPVYSALCDAGFAPCYLTRAEIPKAKIIFLPYTEALSRDSAVKLKEFVNAGGILVALPRLAEYDEGGHPYDVLPGAGLHELFGVTLEDAWVGRESMVPLQGRDDAAKIMVEMFQPGTKLPPEKEAEILSFDLSVGYGGHPLRLIAQAHQAVKAVADGTKVLARHEDNVPALLYRKSGKGAALFLNVYRGWPNVLHVPTDERDVAFARVLRVLAEYAGVAPDAWFENLDSTGLVAPQLVPFRYTGPNGIMKLIGVFNDWRSTDAETRLIINTPVAAVYDVLAGKRLALRDHLGHPSAYVTVPRGTGRLLALLPYEVTGVTVKTDRTRVQAGEPVEVTATLIVSSGPADAHPAELTVYGPDGQPVRDASRHVMLDGQAIRVPTYLDLPAGDYRLVVRDDATRQSGACTVKVTANPAAVKLPPVAPFGWSSGQRRRIDVGPAEMERLLNDLAALYAADEKQASFAYSAYVLERDRGRHRIGQLLAQADWTGHAPVLKRMLERGARLVLMGEDLGVDPATGQPAFPLTAPTALTALSQLTKGSKRFAVRGLPDVLVMPVGKGWLVLDRSSPDRQGTAGPTRMNAWMSDWRHAMKTAGLLPGGEPDPQRLAPANADLNLADWFIAAR
jgi:hypothetical protein